MNRFSHIYIEERAKEYAVTKSILNHFPDSTKIYIKHYKDLFNRGRQDYTLQKEAQKLILAVKEAPFLYNGPDICENFGFQNFYYTSLISNCIYDCHYCYLQGLYPSANMVIFVNINDFLNEVDGYLKKYKDIYLCISYDTDLLALEGLVPYTGKWIEYASKRDNLLIEIRTKSANYSSISSYSPVSNVILAWTLSPQKIIDDYEHLTPNLDARLKCADMAIKDGWKVRLSFEPIIKINGWKEVYAKFMDHVFSIIQPEKLYDINIGTFRMNKDYFKKIGRSRTDTDSS